LPLNDGATSVFVDSDLKFIAALKGLGLHLDLNSFDSRIILQKKVYLAQWCGLDLNSRYGWYIRGPYSTDISHAAYRIQSIFEDERISNILPSFERNEEKQLSKSQELFKAIDQLGEDKAYWYELVASVAFLQESNNLQDEDIFSFLETAKPRMFSKEHVRKALKTLRQFRRK